MKPQQHNTAMLMGRKTMSNSELTIQDVAKAAGVSAATVSRVMTGSAGVNIKKAERVREVIQQLNYRPNPFARNLLKKSSRTIGVLVPQLEDGFYGKIITGIEHELSQAGFQIQISIIHGTVEQEAKALTNFLERQVDGVVLITDLLPEQMLLNFQKYQTPIVLLNRLIPELAQHCIRLDNVEGGASATKYLLQKGHRRIAHITGLLERAGSRERLNGYVQALQEAGIARDDHLIVECDFSEEGGYAAMQRLLARTQFTAVFAGNDTMAVSAMQAARDAHLSIPEDISIIGFDDRSFSRYITPSLTTMHYPMLEMGAAAAQHLMAVLRGENPKPVPLFHAPLIERQSVRQIEPKTKK